MTQIPLFEAFYLAKGYHQEYFVRKPSQSYCTVVIAPKVARFRNQYLSRLNK